MEASQAACIVPGPKKPRSTALRLAVRVTGSTRRQQPKKPVILSIRKADSRRTHGLADAQLDLNLLCADGSGYASARIPNGWRPRAFLDLGIDLELPLQGPLLVICSIMIGKEKQEGAERRSSGPSRPLIPILMIEKINGRRLYAGCEVQAKQAPATVPKQRNRISVCKMSHKGVGRVPSNPVIPPWQAGVVPGDRHYLLAIEFDEVGGEFAPEQLPDTLNDLVRVIIASVQKYFSRLELTHRRRNRCFQNGPSFLDGRALGNPGRFTSLSTERSMRSFAANSSACDGVRP